MKTRPILRILCIFALVAGAFPASASFRDGKCAGVFRPIPAANKPLPRIYVLSGPSGGGKTTLATLLVGQNSQFTLSVSTTTRAPRGKEQNGVDYHFTDVADFKRKIAEGRFAEWSEYNGQYYGTEVATIERAFGAGQSVLALLDGPGTQKIRRLYPNRVTTIFISPPDLAILEARLRARNTETEEQIQKRLAIARHEMQNADQYDYVVKNDQLEQALQDLESSIRTAALAGTPETRP